MQSVQEIIKQIENISEQLQKLPDVDEINEYVKNERLLFFCNFIERAKKNYLSKLRGSITKHEKKSKLKLFLQTSRKHAQKKYFKAKMICNINTYYQDGWKNRFYDNDNNITFMFKGYFITFDSKNCIKSIKKSFILNHLLRIAKVILHIFKHNFDFEKNFLVDKLNALIAISTTNYINYVPTICKLRRSYNCNMYDEIAQLTIYDGWENKIICWFDTNCHVFKLDNVIYMVDRYKDKIDKIIEF